MERRFGLKKYSHEKEGAGNIYAIFEKGVCEEGGGGNAEEGDCGV